MRLLPPTDLLVTHPAGLTTKKFPLNSRANLNPGVAHSKSLSHKTQAPRSRLFRPSGRRGPHRRAAPRACPQELPTLETRGWPAIMEQPFRTSLPASNDSKPEPPPASCASLRWFERRTATAQSGWKECAPCCPRRLQSGRAHRKADTQFAAAKIREYITRPGLHRRRERPALGRSWPRA